MLNSLHSVRMPNCRTEGEGEVMWINIYSMIGAVTLLCKI